jgi:hypothetical protein
MVNGITSGICMKSDYISRQEAREWGGASLVLLYAWLYSDIEGEGKNKNSEHLFAMLSYKNKQTGRDYVHLLSSEMLTS